MRKVKIISGTYGYNNGKRIEPKDRHSAPFELEHAEAERIVALGIAAFVVEKVATVPKDYVDIDINLLHDESGADGKNESEAHIDPEQLKEMTNAELKELAEDMGIDTKFLRKKDDLISAIVSEPVETDEALPVFGAEAPVV